MSSGVRFILSVVGYITLISPCRSFDKEIKHSQFSTELEKLPRFVLVIIDFTIRVMFLFLTAALVEYFLGDYLYESYRLDLVVLTIILLGFIHAISYQIIFHRYRKKKIPLLKLKIYRLLRNICYVPFPVIALIIPVMVIENIRDLEAYKLPYLDKITLTMLFLFFVLGVLEAIFMTRKPLGLDKILTTKGLK